MTIDYIIKQLKTCGVNSKGMLTRALENASTSDLREPINSIEEKIIQKERFTNE